MKNKKDKIITIVIVLVLIISTFIIYNGVTAKEYKLTTCAVCGKNTQCYKVSYKGISEKYRDWVCSKECEKTAISIYDGLKTIGNMIDS